MPTKDSHSVIVTPYGDGSVKLLINLGDDAFAVRRFDDQKAAQSWLEAQLDGFRDALKRFGVDPCSTSPA